MMISSVPSLCLQASPGLLETQEILKIWGEREKEEESVIQLTADVGDGWMCCVLREYGE